MENRKKFLDEIAKKLNIKKPSDWGKVTVQHLQELGGSAFMRLYNDSLFTCLQSIYKGMYLSFRLLRYKDIDWKYEWFRNLPKSYWESMGNRKEFMEKIAKKLKIKNPSDWGKVTVHHFYELGGGALLSSRYNNSLFACLQSIYKGEIT